MLTIDELAREAGLTVRNVRSHQTRGLLPPPEVRGRTGFYGPEHVERLKLILQLQNEGLKLDGIKRLLADPGDRLLALKKAGEEREPPAIVDAAALRTRLGLQPDEAAFKLLGRAIQLGILDSRGDGSFNVPSPALLAAAEEVVTRGISLDHALDLIDRVTRQSRVISREFVQLFLEDLWKPFQASGMPDERWDELAESIEHVRPLAAKALLAVFRRTLDEEVDATIDELARGLRVSLGPDRAG
ncbi:MerR family transcriptional regulator [Solirubrobacter ginsenosidimutans]|uniref:MerR family transcriptional regulator n=1 Tax=Solirubrobacter ginsenosidimutans TaxID=490573 RepID=A0A9X3MXJ7_9ACTN|nr:MerR family transcriptional regulator [Solirubrobacter ginsenosidimutans]MDA0163012.1 MerR family transcriptional regulator [Solirubrobacter ginsenosidimutans]